MCLFFCARACVYVFIAQLVLICYLCTQVTTYKEIIRLLVGQPTEQHIQMILHEWNRAEVHRDVKIAIIQAAIAFLHTPQEGIHDVHLP